MPYAKSNDAVSGSLAECFVTIEGTRYNFIQALNVKADVEKKKVEVSILGKTGKGHKTAGWSGKGTAKFQYNTSLFRKMMKKYKDTGEDLYFDMQIRNEDPSSASGAQTTILKNCNLDNVIIALLDGDADTLSDEISFTFDDFEMPEEFTKLGGME